MKLSEVCRSWFSRVDATAVAVPPTAQSCLPVAMEAIELPSAAKRLVCGPDVPGQRHVDAGGVRAAEPPFEIWRAQPEGRGDLTGAMVGAWNVHRFLVGTPTSDTDLAFFEARTPERAQARRDIEALLATTPIKTYRPFRVENQMHLVELVDGTRAVYRAGRGGFGELAAYRFASLLNVCWLPPTIPYTLDGTGVEGDRVGSLQLFVRGRLGDHMGSARPRWGESGPNAVNAPWDLASLSRAARADAKAFFHHTLADMHGHNWLLEPSPTAASLPILFDFQGGVLRQSIRAECWDREIPSQMSRSMFEALRRIGRAQAEWIVEPMVRCQIATSATDFLDAIEVTLRDLELRVARAPGRRNDYLIDR